MCVGVDGRLYRYDNGVYRSDGDVVARVEARRLLGNLWKKQHAGEVEAWLRAAPPTIGERPRDDVINVANGLLNWWSGTLSAHSPDCPSTVQIPVAFRPGAQCPRILRFLSEVLPADALDSIFEVMGLSLYAGNPMRAAVLLLGPGRNGKSVLLNLIKALVGPENVSAVSLQTLAENRFAAAELFSKLANIYGDLDARAVRQTDVFKTVTGCDPIQAERKYGQFFTFTSFALPIFSANEPPMCADQTEAWFDRWLVVPMERRIPEDRVDPHLIEKLTTPGELEGLLARAVEGLRRLMERRRFAPPPSIREAREKYRTDLDTVAGFLGESCVFEAEGWVLRSQLHAAYRDWCKESGRPPVSARQFNGRLRERYAASVTPATRTGGRRGWAGLRLAG
jgi:putative DNA primase/helicase